MKIYYRIRQIHRKWWVLRYEKPGSAPMREHTHGHFGPFTDIDTAKRSAEGAKKKMINLDTIEIKEKVPYADSGKST